jgi:predicted RNA-binding Zn-ribbon protein involved in translation (DUF1610 family)
MDTAALSLLESNALPDALGHELDVESVIYRAIAGKQPITQRLERRRDTRYAYPYPLTLTPLESALRGDARVSISAIGKHLTIHGVDFYTTSPIAAKEVICQFHSPSCGHALVVELHWCRHNAQGWFENGGRFLRVWKTPASLRVLMGQH